MKNLIELVKENKLLVIAGIVILILVFSSVLN